MAQNGAGGALLQNPGLYSLCVGSRFYCHYFLFLFHTSLKSFGPSPKSVRLKTKIMRKEKSKEKYNSADVRESVP